MFETILFVIVGTLAGILLCRLLVQITFRELRQRRDELVRDNDRIRADIERLRRRQ